MLESVAKEFSVADYAPDIEGLREDLNEATFLKDFGGVSDPRYKDQLADLRKRVQAAKAYAK